MLQVHCFSLQFSVYCGGPQQSLNFHVQVKVKFSTYKCGSHTLGCSFLCLDLWHHFSPQVHEILRTQLKSLLPQEGLPDSSILIATYSSLHSSHFINIQELISVTYPVTPRSNASDGRAWFFVLVGIFQKHPGERLWICDRTGQPGSQCYQLSLGLLVI